MCGRVWRGGVGALTICAGSSSTAMTESRRGHLRTGEQVAWTRGSDMATSSSALRNDTIRVASRASVSTPIATASACVRATRIFKPGAARGHRALAHLCVEQCGQRVGAPDVRDHVHIGDEESRVAANGRT